MSAAPPLPKPAPRSLARPERGLSLVELMVALVAGLLLAAGIGQIFLSTKQTFRARDQLSRLHENGRYAIDMLAHDARMAGSLGCHSRTGEIQNALNNASSLYFDFGNPVGGFEANGTGPGASYSIPAGNPSPSNTAAEWTPQLPLVSPALVGTIIAGTDVLVLRGRVGRTTALVAPTKAVLSIQPPSTSIEAGECSGGTDRINGLCAGNFVMVADCTLTRIFQATPDAGKTALDSTGVIGHGAGGNPGNACVKWDAAPCPEYTFGANSPAEISGVATTVYYIGRRTPPANGPAPGPSLYRRVVNEDVGNANANQAQELVEGVESMQILYGMDLGGGNFRFVTAAGVSDWSTVTSVRLGLLMRTPEEASTMVDTATYVVNGTTLDPYDDRRLRRVVTTTISLRNLSP